MSLLAEAAQAVDPIKAERLRELATESFWSSAKLLEGSEVKLRQVGWADLRNEKFHGDPDPQPSLVAGGENLVGGLGLMQQALGDPQPEPHIGAVGVSPRGGRVDGPGVSAWHSHAGYARRRRWHRAR
ncbi:hypothetical protein V6U77_19805 [Micromonospora sp. CPCC 205546]|uniref:hypothetical protein n=1 Tax=Micromonospora sp. CPCC 205546 TaxID=3122397 RepID=UPI002FEFB2F9